MVRSHLFTFSAALALVGLVAGDGQATVKPSPLFTDGAVLQRDAKVAVFGIADPGEDVTVTFGTANVTGKADNGGQWRVDLPPTPASEKPAALTIAGKANKVTVNNVLVGDVWVCSGQSNMEWSNFASANPKETVEAANHPGVRLFTVPKLSTAYPVKDVNSKWLPCNSLNAGPFSAVGYHFGLNLHKELKVPIGLINTSWGGTICEAWTSKGALDAKPGLQYLLGNLEKARVDFDKSQDAYFDALTRHIDDSRKTRTSNKPIPMLPSPPTLTNPNIATVLSNGMIEPLIPYTIKGAIWYQGESNAGRAFEYRTLLPTMIEDWRARWGQGDFPFFIVQLAPFMTKKATPPVPADKLVDQEPGDSAWAELREAQWLTAQRTPKTGIAVITDLVDDPYDIHPKLKAEVGRRLSLQARTIAYGEKLVDAGPVYTEAKFEGNKATLKFDKVGGGLMAKGDKLTGFSIAGEDRKFVKADAVLDGDKVVVSAANIEKPVAVRFGWLDYPVLNLFNKEGLPATPFRTDDFPGVTQPKK